MNEKLNEPNYNIGRPNPNLNNRDNTNIITNVFSNKITNGDLNSIKRIVQKQNLNLNSCFRENYYASSSTNFTYTIPKEIKNVTALRLASIEIPNSWYLFSQKKNNNNFKIDVKIGNNVFTYDIFVPDGNYTNETLEYYLNHTYFYESGTETPLKYISFSIDKKDFRTSISILQNDVQLRFSAYFINDVNQNMMNTFGWLLGFRLGKYLDIVEHIKSEGLFDGYGDRYIYFSLLDYQYNNNVSNVICFDKCLNEDGILAKIPLTNEKLSLIINENDPLTKTRIYNGPVNIKKIQVKLLDKFGDVIDLNNMDFSFTLEIEMLYECFNFKNVFA